MRTILLATLVASLTSSSAHAGTKLSVKEMTVDGQIILDLDCDLEDGGFFAAAALVGTIAKQKKSLDACAPGGEAFRVTFKWQGAKTTQIEIKAATHPPANKCVIKSFKKLTPTLTGTCTAVILTGNPTNARKAATKLPTKK